MPNTTNFNWPTPADTDLVKDGAAAIRNLGNGVDTSLVDLKGGTTGQILSKASNADMDFTFITPNVGDITEVQAGTGISVASGTGPIPVVTNSMATEITAKGDLIVGTGSGTFDNLPAGTNGHILTADSSVSPTGLKWAAPAGGGKVLQVVNTNTTTETSITSASLTDTTITATITPSAATSKIAIFISANSRIQEGGQTDIFAGAALLRGATVIQDFDETDGFWQRIGGASGTLRLVTQQALIYLDSPNTTSATTYKLQARVLSPLSTINFQKASVPSNILLMEIGA